MVDSLEKTEDPAVSLSIRNDIATQEADLPGQYVKVNLFRNHSLISADSLFTVQTCSLSGSSLGKSKWQRLVQLCEYNWIPLSAVVGLSVVFLEGVDGDLM